MLTSVRAPPKYLPAAFLSTACLSATCLSTACLPDACLSAHLSAACLPASRLLPECLSVCCGVFLYWCGLLWQFNYQPSFIPTLSSKRAKKRNPPLVIFCILFSLSLQCACVFISPSLRYLPSFSWCLFSGSWVGPQMLTAPPPAGFFCQVHFAVGKLLLHHSFGSKKKLIITLDEVEAWSLFLRQKEKGIRAAIPLQATSFLLLRCTILIIYTSAVHCLKDAMLVSCCTYKRRKTLIWNSRLTKKK